VIAHCANLTNAIFQEAILNSLGFYDANITGADFTDALIDPLLRNSTLWAADGVNLVTGVANKRKFNKRIKLCCKTER